MDTQAPRIEDTPGMATDILSDPAAFDMAWAVFDNGVAQLPQPEMERSLTTLIVGLDLAQIHGLLNSIHTSLLNEATSSVRFALLLNFKRMVLDAILTIWPLEKLHGCLSTLHPMECVYMILNSTFVLSSADTDAIASLFGDNFTKAYTVFRYILLWMNWKIYDPSHYDERYYEAYFNDFSKEERKRVMSSIGSDILQYIETHPDKVLETVATSFKEIVPLLEGDHLHPISPKLALDFQTDTGTPATFSLVTDLDGWEMLCTSIYVYIAKRYESSSDAGDQAIDGARDLISISFSTDSDPFHQEISLTDKIIHFAPNPTTCISSILNSSIVESKEQRILILRSYVASLCTLWVLRSKGCRILAQT
ncbi:hypothetical protein BASA83_008485 [Batrachochytrium salamandrivorans]|nr:hypothetical protein BASA83_008485 [Batrachochytrium salamandrivorans]